MARTHGKDANLSINAVALEDELRSIRLRAEVPEADITAFADVYGNFLAGKKNVTIEIEGSLDLAAAAGDDTIFGLIGGGPVSTIVDLTGSGPGANAPNYNCTASGLTGTLVRSYSIELPVGDKASYRASLQNSGQTVRAVA